MNSKVQDKNTNMLFEAVLHLETLEECYRFFEDLCTVQELKAMSQRFVVAKMLTQNQVYSNIVKETGGYRTLFEKMENSTPEKTEE